MDSNFTLKMEKYEPRIKSNNLTCPLHLGEYTPATETHHIVAHKGNVHLFWAQDNLMSECKSCHSKRTAQGE